MDVTDFAQEFGTTAKYNEKREQEYNECSRDGEKVLWVEIKGENISGKIVCTDAKISPYLNAGGF